MACNYYMSCRYGTSGSIEDVPRNVFRSHVEDITTHLLSGATAALIAFTRDRYNKDVSF